MKKTLLAVATAVAALSLQPTAQADTIFGVYAGGQYWDTSTSGRFGTSDDQVSFDFTDDTQTSFYIALEHPVPLLPNIQIRRTTLADQGTTTLDRNYEFNGQVYPVTTTLTADIDLGHTDYILYYEIFDNDLISVDLGINAMNVDGFLQVTDEDGNRNSIEASSWVPTAYGHFRLGIPATDLTLYAKGSFLAIDDSSIRDVEAGIEYRLIENLAVDLNLQLGYRDTQLELDDLDDIYSDLQFKGPYLGLELHF